MITNISEDAVEINDGEVVFVSSHTVEEWQIASNKDFIKAHALENMLIALQTCAYHGITTIELLMEEALEELKALTTPTFNLVETDNNDGQ